MGLVYENRVVRAPEPRYGFPWAVARGPTELARRDRATSSAGRCRAKGLQSKSPDGSEDPMRNPLQEQLLKAGLVKKQNVDAAVRAQKRQRDGKLAATTEQIDARKLQADKAERDRALAAERNVQARAKEKQAQIRQLIEQHRVDGDGDTPYRFADDDRLATVLVGDTVRKQLASGKLVIVRHDAGYALMPRAAGELVRQRGGSVIVDHAAGKSSSDKTDDDHYSKFVVPDDLIW